jgi:hypothetical protein
MLAGIESTAVLTTKSRLPPPRQNIVSRQRLYERLDEAATRPLTIITAPAGFGKSTLASEWAHTRNQHRFAWVSLGPEDNDLARFVASVIAGLQPLEAGIGKAALSLFGSLLQPAPESLMTQLLNEIVDLSAPIVMILDDYHVITDSQIDAALIYAVDHMPGQLRLVVASRKEPSFPLSRWRSRLLVTEIDIEELRFTHEECERFLDVTMHFTLDSQATSTLAARSEGWAAGLQMAALSLQGHIRREGEGCVPKYIQSFGGGHRYIADYLEQIFRQQPPDVRDFLCRTAILDRLCPPLCEAVTGYAHSKSILAHLEQNNLLSRVSMIIATGTAITSSFSIICAAFRRIPMKLSCIREQRSGLKRTGLRGRLLRTHWQAMTSQRSFASYAPTPKSSHRMVSSRLFWDGSKRSRTRQYWTMGILRGSRRGSCICAVEFRTRRRMRVSHWPDSLPIARSSCAVRCLLSRRSWRSIEALHDKLFLSLRKLWRVSASRLHFFAHAL